MKTIFPRTLAALCLLCLPVQCLAMNPVQIPIIQNAMDVHTRRFAQIPDFKGKPAKILCMVPRLRTLYVCTSRRIYKITRLGRVKLFFDVEKAMLEATGRKLNFDSVTHGGLRSVAFHPKFASNRLLYTSVMEDRPRDPENYQYVSDAATPIGADSVLIEWKYSSTKKKPEPSSYRQVLRVGMPVFDHTIRQIAFYRQLLYIAHGDGSVQSATAGGGQNNDALGKILRINPLRNGLRPYRIPRSNPFTSSSTAMPKEVYAVGFRNPHHICFGRDGTLYSADAGRGNVEEVNLVQRGGNYGWSDREGTFVHVGGGLMTGIRPLPANDANFGYIYPAAQYGHEGATGSGFIGQAIAGACPVENGSPMSGNYFYGDFPKSGRLFFSRIDELKRARTRGAPNRLTQARTRQAKIFFDHDNDPTTPPLLFDTLGEVMRFDSGLGTQERVDLRFGRGSRGELYWSSKKNGRVYIFTSSLRGGPGGRPEEPEGTTQP